MAKKNKSGVDVRYQDKERAALVRNIRKSVIFNKHEMNAIAEYRRQFGLRSLSALIRQATMEHVLRQLDEGHPTLF